jgi:hypothetical protein
MATQTPEQHAPEIDEAELAREMEKLLSESDATTAADPPASKIEDTLISESIADHTSVTEPNKTTEQNIPETAASTPIKASEPKSREKKKVILILALDEKIPIDNVSTYSSLMDTLLSTCTVTRAKKPSSALSFLSSHTPSAILCTDAGLTLKVFDRVYSMVLDYVRAGGTLILMANFASFLVPTELIPFFRKADLPWEMENYFRTTVHLSKNPVTGLSDSLRPFLKEKYSQNAVFLKGVKKEDAWYRPHETSVDESFTNMHFEEGGVTVEADPITDFDQTPVAVASVGKGKIGFLGDVTFEKESESVVLAICGIDQSSTSESIAATP